MVLVRARTLAQDQKFKEKKKEASSAAVSCPRNTHAHRSLRRANNKVNLKADVR